MKPPCAMRAMCAAVLCGAGLAGHELLAQSVPVASRNVAGYIRIGVASRGLYQIHYPLMGLNQPSVTVNDIMGDLPNGSSLTFWDAAAQDYLSGPTTEVKLLGAWIPGTNDLTQKTFWLQVGDSAQAAFDIYLTGEVPDARSLPHATVSLAVAGSNTVNLAGYAYPAEIRWTDTSFAQAAGNGSSMSTFDPATQTYLTAVKQNGVWSRDPLLQPGQGFWLHSSGLAQWTETKPYLYP